ncbi:MAG: hypothetical protein WC608_02250 [Parcubacteria group bacterium]
MDDNIQLIDSKEKSRAKYQVIFALIALIFFISFGSFLFNRIVYEPYSECDKMTQNDEFYQKLNAELDRQNPGKNIPHVGFASKQECEMMISDTQFGNTSITRPQLLSLINPVSIAIATAVVFIVIILYLIFFDNSLESIQVKIYRALGFTIFSVLNLVVFVYIVAYFLRRPFFIRFSAEGYIFMGYCL